VEYTRSSPGSLFFNEDGIAGCPKCGWRGIPTFTGGRTPVVLSRHEFADVRRVPSPGTEVPADVDHRCPSCEHDPDVACKPRVALQGKRTHSGNKAKRKAAKAARRRNR